ncbi:MAG: MBL fold metallo-hydrolase [Oscillatoriales cyanobacterium SM2_2_1]|nr:MBL fold metallo-hydrolase [Oscillatoriales cyanobacterium SM2_2_1]
MLFRPLFDPETSTYTYLIGDRTTGEAALVDSVLEQVDRDLQVLSELGLTLRYTLETHVHADHVTGAGKLRQQTQCDGVVPAGAMVECADQTLQDNEVLMVGTIPIQAIATPGHTDSHMTFLVDQTHLLTGDSLLIRGCGRTDFQSGDPGLLFDAIVNRLFNLPEETVVCPGHDYRGQIFSTIGEEKRWNPRLVNRTRAQFIEFMNGLNLPDPKKIAEAVPANQQCGQVAA